MEGRTARPPKDERGSRRLKLNAPPRPRGGANPKGERNEAMDDLVNEILDAADQAVNERWHEVGEVSDATMAKLRELMERYHKVAEGGVK